MENKKIDNSRVSCELENLVGDTWKYTCKAVVASHTGNNEEAREMYDKALDFYGIILERGYTGSVVEELECSLDKIFDSFDLGLEVSK